MEMKLSRSSAGKLAAVCKLNEPRPLSRCWPFTSATHNLPLSLSAPSQCEPPPHPPPSTTSTSLLSLSCHLPDAAAHSAPPALHLLKPRRRLFSTSSSHLEVSIPGGIIRRLAPRGGERGVSIWGRDSFTGAASKFSVSDKTFPHYNKCIQQI